MCFIPEQTHPPPERNEDPETNLERQVCFQGRQCIEAKTKANWFNHKYETGSILVGDFQRVCNSVGADRRVESTQSQGRTQREYQGAVLLTNSDRLWIRDS